jgi:hypothetical protein
VTDGSNTLALEHFALAFQVNTLPATTPPKLHQNHQNHQNYQNYQTKPTGFYQTTKLPKAQKKTSNIWLLGHILRQPIQQDNFY